MTDMVALLRTQFWNCCVKLQLFLSKNSRAHLHSPLSIEARICLALFVSRLAKAEG